jgi:hypothetical protein
MKIKPIAGHTFAIECLLPPKERMPHTLSGLP